MSALRHWLESAVGRSVVHLLAEFYVAPDGEEHPSPMRLWFTFDGLQRKCVRLAADGWRMLVDDYAPTELDMGSAGSTVLRDVALEEPYAHCVSTSLVEAALIHCGDGDEGFQLAFAGRPKVYFLNWGDEFHVGIELPPDADESQLRSEHVARA